MGASVVPAGPGDAAVLVLDVGIPVEVTIVVIEGVKLVTRVGGVLAREVVEESDGPDETPAAEVARMEAVVARRTETVHEHDAELSAASEAV